MSSCIKKIALFVTTVFLFTGNITPPANNNFNQVSKELNSGWGLGFNKAHAGDVPCPPEALECYTTTGTPPLDPTMPGAIIEWGDLESDELEHLGASRQNAGAAESKHYAENAKEYCFLAAKLKENRCKQGVAVASTAGVLVCVVGTVVFTPVVVGAAFGAACGAFVAGATTLDVLHCERTRINDDFDCSTLP
ncbi:MAG: hypothetical protein HRT38_16720 [Alteromonadaceae bacterium]|nr:hypothetical protein [Alteromonadaceae bacterium]